jgi:hypothetical protein
VDWRPIVDIGALERKGAPAWPRTRDHSAGRRKKPHDPLRVVRPKDARRAKDEKKAAIDAPLDAANPSTRAEADSVQQVPSAEDRSVTKR